VHSATLFNQSRMVLVSHSFPSRLVSLVCLWAACGLPGTAAYAQMGAEMLTKMGTEDVRKIVPHTKFAEDSPKLATDMPAPADGEKQPVVLEAERMAYDKENQIVVAVGDVEVVQGNYILRTDRLTYFQAENLVRAEGNVSMLQPSGDVYFAENAELTGDMKSGVVDTFRARLADNSVFAARSAVRVNPAITKMKKAVYSPCKLCKGRAPFWQMRAEDVKVDNIEEEITYDNATMELAGIPVLYTPYMSHPTPDAGPKNGFLIPEYSQSSSFGTMVRVPYYLRLAPDKELTLTPWYMTAEGPLLEGEYAQVTDKGNYTLEFSGTYPEERDDTEGSVIKGREFRGHIFAHGEENLSTYSRVGFDLQRSTDDTYLRRYGFGSQYSLTSRAYAEAAKGRNYALAESMMFQGLREQDDSSTTPRILPSIDSYYETEPLAGGARLKVAANMQNLARPEGSEYQRGSITPGVRLPYVTEGGHVFETEANVRGDVYSVSNQTLLSGEDFDGEKTRAIPQAALTWRYPLITRVNNSSLTVEPIVVGVAQPKGGNPDEIPNEDNRVVELTDTNIFSVNRMPGYDTVDSGSRVAYGFRGQMLLPGGETIDGLIGQSYNADETPFPNARVLGENISDYIGRVGFAVAPFTFSYRFAIDQGSLDLNRNEVWTGYSHGPLSLTMAYLAIEDSPYVSDSEEALGSANLQVADEWSLYASARRDLALDAMIAATGGVIYQNECFTLLTQLQRTYTRDRDIEPATEFSVRVGFKNLGEFGTQ
jgi:LPS-assembly protein